MVVGNWGWMVGGSRWFVVDSVWVVSFIEVFIKRAQKSLEIRAKYVARKIARFDAGAVVFANALTVVAGVGAVSIGGCGVVVVSVQILPACNHGQIWAEVRVQAGRWWWWSWVVVGNWGWMVGGSRWFVVDSVWVISFIEVFIRRA